jgi:hypothetical protein
MEKTADGDANRNRPAPIDIALREKPKDPRCVSHARDDVIGKYKSWSGRSATLGHEVPRSVDECGKHNECQ